MQALVADTVETLDRAIRFLGAFLLCDTAIVDAEVIRGTTWGAGVWIIDALVVDTDGTSRLAIAVSGTDDAFSLVAFIGAITFSVLRTTSTGIRAFFETDPCIQTLWCFAGFFGLATQTRIVSAAEISPWTTALTGIGINIGMEGPEK